MFEGVWLKKSGLGGSKAALQPRMAALLAEDGEWVWAAEGEGGFFGSELADSEGQIEDGLDGEDARQFERADGGEAHGGGATALGTIRLSAELAGGDEASEIGRNAGGGLGEDAVFGRLRRLGEFGDHHGVHVELRECLAE